jgi:uncharacterized protein YbjT (DUF2867 family)
MRVVIAGGNGQIARILERLLVERGDEALGLIRNPEQADALRALGAEAVVADLEEVDAAALADHLQGADAVVFAAGAGPGSGIPRKTTVDRDAAILLADAAEAAGVRRYLMVSAMGADVRTAEEVAEPVFAAYLRAKAEADAEVSARGALDVTILRPGRLTDEAGTGRVALAPSTGRGSVPREDVAAVLVGLLDAPGTAGRTLELVSGETPVVDAVAAVSRG